MKYLLLILILTGCYSAKKAQQQVDKADSTYPEIVAKLARDKYPCTDLLKPDTTVIYQDSLVYIECPEITPVNPFEIVRVDTVNNIVTRTVKVPVNIRIPGTTIIKWYEDSAKIALYIIDINRYSQENQKQAAKIGKLEKKIGIKNKELWVYRSLLLLILLYLAYKFWKNITTLKIK